MAKFISIIKEYLNDKRNKKVMKILLSVVITSIIFLKLKNELYTIDYAQILITLRSIPRIQVLILFLLGLLSVSLIMGYDLVLFHFFKPNITYSKLLRFSWIANAMNNFIGFGGVIAFSFRNIMYKSSAKSSTNMIKEKHLIYENKILLGILNISLASTTGLSFMFILGFLNVYNLNHWFTQGILYLLVPIAFSLYLFLFLFSSKIPFFKKIIKRENYNSHFKFRLMLVVASIIEWSAALFYFTFIIKLFEDAPSIRYIISVYTLSVSLGIISMVPGGLGSFDILAITWLKMGGMSIDHGTAAILMFRLFYYIIPWIIAAILAVYEFLVAKFLWKIRIPTPLEELGTNSLSTLVLLSGIILIGSSLTPALLYRFNFMKKILSLPFLQLSNRVSIIFGFLLLILSHGIRKRTKFTWIITLICLLLGAISTFLKGFDIEEAIFLITVAILLFISKNAFYRKSLAINYKKLLQLLIITLVIALSYGIIGELIYKDFVKGIGIKNLLYKHPEDFGKNIFWAFAWAWIITVVLILISPERPLISKPDNDTYNKLREFLNKYPGNIMTHLLFLGDKNIFFAQESKVVMGYTIFKDNLVVLGDPIGEEKLFKKAILEIIDFADLYGLKPIFYEISQDYLYIYHDFNFDFFKMGEEAIVDLLNFDLSGKKKKDLRNTKNKIIEGEMFFEILSPPFSTETMDILRTISNEWLDGNKEKKFSLGWFNENYLNLSDIAVIKDTTNNIIGFANIMPLYDNEIISIDLMRFKKDAPRGIMDALFLSIFDWAVSKGYKYFNFGMAPLSSVGDNPYSAVEEKLASLLYKYGTNIYKFSGLRKYKEKYAPIWRPRYLAYPSQVRVYPILLDISRLISEFSIKDITKK